MLFCQICQVLSVVVFSVAMSSVDQLVSHRYYLEFRSYSEADWNNEFKQVSFSAAVILLFVISVIQIVCLLRVSALLLSTSMQGLRFGDQQQRSYSIEYFAFACFFTVPIIALKTARQIDTAKTQFQSYAHVFDYSRTLINATNVTQAAVLLVMCLSSIGIYGSFAQSIKALNFYAKAQAFLTLLLFSMLVFYSTYLIKFSWITVVGGTSYFQENWNHLIRVSSLDEFKENGDYACPGGKYLGPL